MAQEGKIGLTIDRETWKDLTRLKLETNLKTLDEVIKYLLEKYGKK